MHDCSFIQLNLNITKNFCREDLFSFYFSSNEKFVFFALIFHFCQCMFRSWLILFIRLIWQRLVLNRKSNRFSAIRSVKFLSSSFVLFFLIVLVLQQVWWWMLDKDQHLSQQALQQQRPFVPHQHLRLDSLYQAVIRTFLSFQSFWSISFVHLCRIYPDQLAALSGLTAYPLSATSQPPTSVRYIAAPSTQGQPTGTYTIG